MNVGTNPGLNRMNAVDPSAPPEAGKSSTFRHDGAVHQSRTAAIRHGLWRGAKFGFVAFCVVFPAMGLGILLFCIAFVPGTLQRALFEVQRSLHEAGQTDVLSAIGWTAVFFGGFGTLYGAIPGALIGGLTAAIRWRPPAQRQEDTSRDAS